MRHNVLVPDACEGIGFSMASTNRETSHTMASCCPFTPRPFSGTVRLGGKSVLVRIDWDPSLHPHRTIAFRSPRSSGSPLPGQPRGSPSPPLVSPSDTRHVTGREENGGAGSFRRGRTLDSLALGATLQLPCPEQRRLARVVYRLSRACKNHVHNGSPRATG